MRHLIHTLLNGTNRRQMPGSLIRRRGGLPGRSSLLLSELLHAAHQQLLHILVGLWMFP